MLIEVRDRKQEDHQRKKNPQGMLLGTTETSTVHMFHTSRDARESEGLDQKQQHWIQRVHMGRLFSLAEIIWMLKQ
jgi:hypothetical protein